MNTSATPPPLPNARASAPAGTRVTPAPLAPPLATPGEDLDPEEDVAPNLGGEDQMQDA